MQRFFHKHVLCLLRLRRFGIRLYLWCLVALWGILRRRCRIIGGVNLDWRPWKDWGNHGGLENTPLLFGRLHCIIRPYTILEIFWFKMKLAYCRIGWWIPWYFDHLLPLLPTSWIRFRREREASATVAPKHWTFVRHLVPKVGIFDENNVIDASRLLRYSRVLTNPLNHTFHCFQFH